MTPWVFLDSAPIPGESAELRLMQRSAEFSIMLGGNELMNSRLGGSEAALAALACSRIRDRPRPHVLIGGLGMGFTLRAALAVLVSEATITVAELVPSVVAWARGPLASLFNASLEDARVHVLEADVAQVIGSERDTFDAILLDVDNGPDGLTTSANGALYAEDGLRASRRALRRNGVLAVWSSAPDRTFTDRLRRAGFKVGEHRVRANGRTRGARHVIWIAEKQDASPEPLPRPARGR